MKNIIPLLAITLSVIVASCTGNDKEAKRKELTDLKKQAAEINAKISTLERELGPVQADENNSKQKFVSLQPVNIQPFTHFVEVDGRVESDQNITVSARSAGSITSVRAERGQKVNKGQVLATIDATIVLKGIEELKSSLDLATTIYEKQKNLWDQHIGTEVQFLQAKNNKESLEKKLASINEQYEMSLIKSTINGVVDEVYIKEGENIGPGVPAFRVVGGGDYKVIAEIPENYLSKIVKGNEVQIFLPDLQETVQSKIATVSSVIGATNRTFSIEIILPRQIKNIKANMLADVKIKDYASKEAIVVPINVIQRSEDGEYVFVAEGTQAKRKDVKVGQSYKTNVEVLAGLKPGDKIITAGYTDLVDGQQIKF